MYFWRLPNDYPQRPLTDWFSFFPVDDLGSQLSIVVARAHVSFWVVTFGYHTLITTKNALLFFNKIKLWYTCCSGSTWAAWFRVWRCTYVWYTDWKKCVLVIKTCGQGQIQKPVAMTKSLIWWTKFTRRLRHESAYFLPQEECLHTISVAGGWLHGRGTRVCRKWQPQMTKRTTLHYHS